MGVPHFSGVGAPSAISPGMPARGKNQLGDEMSALDV
jgi:hypothetical protein